MCVKASVPSSQTVSEQLTEDTTSSCYGSDVHVSGVQAIITDVVDEAGDNDKLPVGLHSDDEMRVNHTSDAVVPSTAATDVQQEAACRVAQYLSQYIARTAFLITN